MTWVKIDDGFAAHPKVVAAGPLAMAMQVAGLCYCNRNGTDGFIPRGVARTLVDWEFIQTDGLIWTVAVTSGMRGEDVAADFVIELLLDAGMWYEEQGGYRIHDYHDYQPSRAEVEADRKQKSEAGKKGAESRWGGKRDGTRRSARHDSRDGTSDGEPMADQCPDPVPVPEPSSSSSSVFVEACALLAQRALAQQPPGSVKVAAKWLAATHIERMERHAAAVADLDVGGLTAEELADALEPDPSKPRPALRRVFVCDVCQDTQQVRNDMDLTKPPLVPCPSCSSQEVAS